jgi:hypothetical protein
MNRKYCAYLRARFYQNSFSGNIRAGAGSSPIAQFELDPSQNGNEAVQFIPLNDPNIPIDRWVYLKIGSFRATSTGEAEVHFLGGNPYWTGAIDFDYIGIIPYGVHYEVKRLFLLEMGNVPKSYTQRSQQSDETVPSLLRKLDKEIVLIILSYV